MEVKHMPSIVATLKFEEEDPVMFILNKKTFSTGSRGFHGQGKAEFDGKRYQVNLMAIEIGSKPKPETS